MIAKGVCPKVSHNQGCAATSANDTDDEEAATEAAKARQDAADAKKLAEEQDAAKAKRMPPRFTS